MTLARTVSGGGKRYDIQGLRALAVLLVVSYHIWPAKLPGGYIGVDVFFVISGYLITAHLLGEVARTGTVSLTRFWARRVRRLLPAAFLVLIASALIAILIVPEAMLKQNLAEISASAFYGLNWLLASNSVDYLASSNMPSVVQHYWTLSVEEQFYIIWPLLMLLAIWLGVKLKAKSTARTSVTLFAAVFVLSLVASIWFTRTMPEVSYFATYTRAWEFAAGGLLAAVPIVAVQRLPSWALDALSWVALACVLVPAVLYTDQTPFPGWTAAIPVAGVVLLIALGDRTSVWSPQYLARAGYIQVLGDVSYSLYLWHWPLIIAAPILLGHSVGAKSGLALLALAILLAIVTKKFVEDPLRSSNGPLGSRKRSFAFMAAGMVLVVGAMSIVNFANRSDVERIEAAISDTEGCFGFYALQNDCADPYDATGPLLSPAFSTEDRYARTPLREDYPCLATDPAVGNECVFGETDDPLATVVLFGDSHSLHLIEPLVEVAEANQWQLLMFTRSSCSGVETPMELDGDEFQAKHDGCVAWGESVRQKLAKTDGIDLILLASQERWNKIVPGTVDAALEELSDAAATVAVITDVPGITDRDVKAPACVELAIDAGDTADPCAQKKNSNEGLVTTAAESLGLPIIDLRAQLSKEGLAHAVIGDTIVYFDNNHLTRSFARTLSPWLDEQMSRLVPAR